MTLPDHLTWRSPTLDDTEAMSAHLRRVHDAETLDFVAGPEFYSWLLNQPDIDLEHDLIVGVDTSGEIVAHAGSWVMISEEGARAWTWFEADPDHADLKPRLAHWARDRALAQLSDTPPGVPRFIRIAIEEHRESHRRHVEDLGLTKARSFVEMRLDLHELADPRPVPDGYEVVPWDEAHSEGARAASNVSFADHWGSLPLTTEQWRALLPGSDTFRADLSFLAIDEDGTVASICLCTVDPEDDPDLLWMDRIGTLPSARRRGLASRLIEHSMSAAAAAGLTAAGLEVDESSHTGATLVYERLGFAFTKRSIHYVEDLEPR